jgi:geranylgeranyl diphosphate synthase type I
VTQGARLVDLVQSRIDGFLDDRSPILSAIAGEVAPFADFSRDFLRGGKRFRALFCYWGWQAVQSAQTDFDPLVSNADRDLESVVGVATGLEFFHAAALVHDDLIDNSDSRRGRPSAHRFFENSHRAEGFAGDGASFGRASAILLGDLLLCWSDELIGDTLAVFGDRDAAAAARAEFNRMRVDVTAGQYLDVLEENAWPTIAEEDVIPRALRVITYKSAKYSIEAPLAIGASLGGASISQLESLRSFGLPLGIAYQLRDDLLGVYGDPEVTGKPAGDDLVEGKRTVLIALARELLPINARRSLDELIGDRDLDEQQIRLLQTTIRQSGAVDRVETLIAENVSQALAALDSANISRSARTELSQLAHRVTVRTA